MNQTYTVKSGDTLFGISNQFGVSVTELAELNGIKGSLLQVGKVLKIPLKSGNNPNNLFMYTVKSGDTLYSIAKKYNTTIQEIMNLNYFKTPNLTIGQQIRIPEMYFNMDEMTLPNYVNYIVKKGDTLYSIAKSNNLDIDTIIKDNSLTSNNLKVGQILRIRLREGQTLDIEECYGSDYEIPVNTTPTITYIVKKGDSLYKIASNYNTSVDNIKKINNLSSNNLSIGQQIKIPTNNNMNNQTIYIVKKGDNLYSIARKYNTTVDTIKKKNNLFSNNLSIGQKLII
ncbi:MAG: LysM peptidoglycan-binding domain-containing protein [Bacilli bacterium]|nr:LysM peptidoglycan-binding domain-containing protein [Bacilli bacterium]